MNIYDFDETIYKGDTCKDVVKYGLIKHPFLTLNSLVKAFFLKKKYDKGLVSYEHAKEVMLSFIFKTKNYEDFLNRFVDSHMKNVKPWYKDIQTENDIIASASYEIWISMFAERLGIKYVIATKTDKNGKIVGKNCKASEKVNRLNKEFKNVKYIHAYSDSKVDTPILELAKESYVVEGDKLIPYKKNYPFKNTK